MIGKPPRDLDAGGSGVSAVSPIPGMEPLFTAEQVAGYLQLDVTSTRRIFLDRPDVMKIGRTTARVGKRSYVTLRIPLSAVQKFVRERSR